MANEPDNLVLAQLREIRATLAGHSSQFARIDERFAQMDRRFDQLDKRFEDFHALKSHAWPEHVELSENARVQHVRTAWHG